MHVPIYTLSVYVLTVLTLAEFYFQSPYMSYCITTPEAEDPVCQSAFILSVKYHNLLPYGTILLSFVQSYIFSKSIGFISSLNGQGELY